MARPTFRAYVVNIEAKTGKSLDDFWKMASERGFVKHGKVVVEHSEMLTWLKSEIGLVHVHASFVVLYLRLRTDDPHVSARMKKWATSTGYSR